MAHVRGDIKNPKCGCRPSSQSKTASTHSFSIQDILGLDKNGTQEKSAVDFCANDSNSFSNSDTVIKIEPGSPTTTHLGKNLNIHFKNFALVRMQKLIIK